MWQRNLAYLVTSTVTPGGYRIHYGLNASVPPFGGTDAGGGTQPSPIDVGDVESFTLANLQPVAPAGAAPQLVSAEPRDHAVVLTWSAVADAVGYRVVYGVASVDENHLDVGATTTQTVTGLANDTAYRFAVLSRTQATYRIAVTALDSTQSRHESAFSETATIALGPVVGRAAVERARPDSGRDDSGARSSRRRRVLHRDRRLRVRCGSARC